MVAGTVVGMPAGRLLCAAVSLVLLAGCNDEASINKNPHSGVATASPVNGVQQLTLTTGNDYRFHPSTLTVRPGRVRVILENTAKPGAGPPHNLQVTGLPAADVPLVAPGQSAAVVFVAPAPGRYHLVCSIHVAQGQTGTLVVLPK
jgi:plastocyanin